MKGTSRYVYGGTTTYRGRSYHYVDQSSSLAPGFVERSYMVWAGGHFRQAATVATDAQKNVLEIVFDRTFGIAVQEDASGTAQIIHNGDVRGSSQWRFVSSSGGKVKITVPAGTFQATKWEATLRLGQMEVLFNVHSVGLTDIRIESHESINGSLVATTARELTSGPVR